MVAGAAALLMQSQKDRFDSRQGLEPLAREEWLSPLEVKARLMNTAEVRIRDTGDGGLAPITRIGGGEVRVDRAIAAPVAAWDDDESSAALSFGFVDVADRTVTLKKRVRLRNYSRRSLVYRLSLTFRYADSATS